MFKLLKIDDKTMGLICPFGFKDVAKSFGDYRWDMRGKMWLYPIDRFKIKEMKRMFKSIDVDRQLEELLDAETKDCSVLEAIKTAPYTDAKKTVETHDYKFKVEPRDHQYAAFLYGLWALKLMGGYLLLDEMGVGKTPEALWVLDYLFQEKQIEKIYWFTRKGAKRDTARKAALFTDLRTVVIEGTRAQRAKLLAQDADLYVLNYECGPMFNDELLEKVRSQAMVIDEIQVMRNPKPVAFSRFAFEAEPKFKIGMTGTPVHNVPQNLFMLVQWVKKFWSNRWGFYKRYIQFGGYGDREIVGYQHLDELSARLNSVSIRRIKDECLNLPPKTYENRFLEMSGDQRAAYAAMKDACILLWQNKSEEEITLAWANIKAKLVRLSQIADGFLSEGVGLRMEWLKDNCKLRELEDLLEDTDDKIVVWSVFVPPVKMLYERFKDKYGAMMMYGETSEGDREAAVKRFYDDPKCRLFISQLHTGGVAIDLTCAQVQVFWKLSWVWADNQQAEDRLHRIGTKGTVNVVRLIAGHTIDEVLLKGARTKEATARTIQGDIPRMNKELLREIFEA